MAASQWREAMGAGAPPADADFLDYIEFWHQPECAGWLDQQGEHTKAWRRRWFVLKQGMLFWFKDSDVDHTSVPRGVIFLASCLAVKGAEGVPDRKFAFELSTPGETMYFAADSEEQKEQWINSIVLPLAAPAGTTWEEIFHMVDTLRAGFGAGGLDPFGEE
ncbi:hypothetical protein ACQJBY_024094 [Aegilops geniculata]